jgi:LPS-assembly lipoprotein
LPANATSADRAVASDLASVSIAPIADRQGQELRNRLQSKLHLPGAGGSPGRYVLHVALGEYQQSLAVRQTGLATRANLYMNANYTMVESATGGAVLTGSSVGIASYDLLDQDFATITAINDARTRVIERLAEDLRNKLAVHFSTAPAVAAAPAAGQPPTAGAPPAQPPVVLVPSPATEPTIASPAGTPIDLPQATSGFGDQPGATSTPVGPPAARPGSGGLP